MVDIVKNNLDKIIDACKNHQVKELYLFGSAAREKDFSPESDIDLLFTLNTDSLPEPPDNYLDNLEDLEITLKNILQRKVDLVRYGNFRNKYREFYINRDKIMIYGNA